ncbi:hypothetical protein C4J81_13280 [Deltaproteobacteria bacterium Smac51]|nr:hypothetical protein C4J81_13280 [Deltaproteobacteria bacterium Smac51]
MKNTVIQQKINPLVGYVLFLIFAFLYSFYVIPVVFPWLLKTFNLNNFAVIYALFESLQFGSLYFLAIFFISPSYIIVSKINTDKWFRSQSQISCIVFIAAHYIIIFIVFFLIYHFFTEASDFIAETPDDILLYIFFRFDLKILLGFSGFYFLACYFVINSSISYITAEIFQYYIWRIPRKKQNDN